MNQIPSTNQPDNLKLRFRLFAVAWLLGAILCLGRALLGGGNLAALRLLTSAVFLLMIPFTILRKKPARLIGGVALGLITAEIGGNAGTMGTLLLYDPFIWHAIAEILILGLTIIFCGDQRLKQAFNVKPRELKRKTLRNLVITIPMTIIVIWFIIVRILPTRIPSMPDTTRIQTEPVSLQKSDNAPGGFKMRQVLVNWIPIPEKSYLKTIWQGRDLTDPLRHMSIATLSDDGIGIWIRQRTQTALLIDGSVMLKQMGAVGPYDSAYKWARWIATDRTSFLSAFFRGLVLSLTSSNEDCEIFLLETPDYLGAVEKKPSEGYNTVTVDLISRDADTELSLQYSSDRLTTDQLWERMKPVISSIQPLLKVTDIKAMIANLQKAQRGEASYDEASITVNKEGFRSLDECMKAARLALKEKRHEDAKWALVYPLRMNYEGGTPYVLFGRALLQQGHPRDAAYFFRKAEFFMKDDPELKALQEEAERELGVLKDGE